MMYPRLEAAIRLTEWLAETGLSFTNFSNARLVGLFGKLQGLAQGLHGGQETGRSNTSS